MKTMRFDVTVKDVPDELTPEMVAELLDLAITHGLADLIDRSRPASISHNDVEVVPARGNPAT